MFVAGIDCYLITITDPHMGEYVPAHWRIIEWFSGFTGSAGTLVITKDFAGLWTDSRYFLQAENQLTGTGISLVKLKIPHTPEYISWIVDNLSTGNTLGYDGELVSIVLTNKITNALEKRNIQIDTSVDLISDMWTDRPGFPVSPVFEHKKKFAGLSRTEKISRIRSEMEKEEIDYQLLTALDDIAFTFNLRASDVSYSPLLLSHALISKDACKLFVNSGRIDTQLSEDLEGDGVEVIDYKMIYSYVARIPDPSVLSLSPGAVNTRLFHAITPGCRIEERISIPTRMKSVKGPVELWHIDETMVKDGVALSRFFCWLEENIGRIRITEMSLADRLEKFREEQTGFFGPSFATIAGYRENGAIVHYKASSDTDKVLEPDGILLLDSGGQYFGGTTDITRTISLGNPSARERKDFTLALKGTIQLAMTKFPVGTRGYQIEAFARRPLWNHGMNYGHGTGHGVGYFLNVHEGPQTIGSAASGNQDVALEPGMILSDEPAFYREGQYGIRTENLLVVEPDRETDSGVFLKFRTLSLCYLDNKLIDPSLFLSEELQWVNDYHQHVFEKLSPHLDPATINWLKEKTKLIKVLKQ